MELDALEFGSPSVQSAAAVQLLSDNVPALRLYFSSFMPAYSLRQYFIWMPAPTEFSEETCGCDTMSLWLCSPYRAGWSHRCLRAHPQWRQNHARLASSHMCSDFFLGRVIYSSLMTAVCHIDNGYCLR